MVEDIYGKKKVKLTMILILVTLLYMGYSGGVYHGVSLILKGVFVLTQTLILVVASYLMGMVHEECYGSLKNQEVFALTLILVGTVIMMSGFVGSLVLGKDSIIQATFMVLQAFLIIIPSFLLGKITRKIDMERQGGIRNG